jgi:carbonic anhydrase/acetyltransferase-like protein (isoleucine patch superfamily)
MSQIDPSAYAENVNNVRDNASIRDNSRVLEQAVVRDAARIRGRAVISGSALVKGDAIVGDNARVELFAMVSGGAVVAGNAHISGNAHVGFNGCVAGDAQVDGNALILNTQGVICGRVGHYDWTAFYDSHQGFVLRFGCQRLPLNKWSRSLKKIVTRHEPRRVAYYTKVIRSIIVLARASLRAPTTNEKIRSRQ